MQQKDNNPQWPNFTVVPSFDTKEKAPGFLMQWAGERTRAHRQMEFCQTQRATRLTHVQSRLSQKTFLVGKAVCKPIF